MHILVNVFVDKHFVTVTLLYFSGIHYYGKSSKKGEGSSKYSNYNYANQVDGYTIAQPNKADRRIQSVLCLSVVTLVMTALLI